MRGLILVLVLLIAQSYSTIAAEQIPQSKFIVGTGIEGVIFIGPIRGGPSRVGISDSRPLAETEFKVENQKEVIMSFKTDSEGRFRISLPAGRYSISSRPRRCSFAEVDVVLGEMKHVQWKCDTGIR